MAGIYIHIPFCKQACHYCDFHFSTSLKTKGSFLDAIIHEIDIQRDYLAGAKVDTIYFGGGTPSVLHTDDLNQIISKLKSVFSFSPEVEMTIEANPDDLTLTKLQELKNVGFNRLSIGIQTFDDQLLAFYNRAHTSLMAEESVRNAQDLGFENISIDIIFGAPNQLPAALEADLQKALALDTPHISIYGLTIEEKTAFGKWHKSGRLIPLDEEMAAQHFELIMKTLKTAGFVQYEISNFSKPGFESRHNSAYWQGHSYLGLGPSAHSYNGETRQFNVANNAKYIKILNQNQVPCQIETLTSEDKINELVLIQMRTSNGLDLEQLKKQHNYDLLTSKKEELDTFIKAKKVIIQDHFLRFTDSGKLLADFIIEKLII